MDVVRRWQDEGASVMLDFNTRPHRSDRWTATAALDYVNLHWYYIRQDTSSLDVPLAGHGRVHHQSHRQRGTSPYAITQTSAALRTLHPIVFNDLFCLRDQFARSALVLPDPRISIASAGFVTVARGRWLDRADSNVCMRSSGSLGAGLADQLEHWLAELGTHARLDQSSRVALVAQPC